MADSSSTRRRGRATPSPGEAPASGVQVVARVASVLRSLADAPSGLGLSELAVSVGLPKSTVHRLVAALEKERLVSSPAEGKIHLGPEVARLGAATRDDVRDRLHPYLVSLHREIDETVDLSVLDGDTVRFIDHIPAPHRLRAVSMVGAAFPLHCTANGKAFLAALPERQLPSLLPARLPRLTDDTITSQRALRQELLRVREHGVAYDREEHTLGISAIGAVVRDPYGPVAAISVPIPSQRFEANAETAADALRSVAGRCSELLGGSHEPTSPRTTRAV